MTLYTTIRKHEIEVEVKKAEVKAAKLKRPHPTIPVPTEHEEQAVVIEWWIYQAPRFRLPELALYAVPNGGLRHVAVAGQLKAEGVRKGAPDLILDVARGIHHGLRIEMKSLSRSARMSEEQREFQEYLNGAGYLAITCIGATAAIEAITHYLKG